MKIISSVTRLGDFFITLAIIFGKTSPKWSKILGNFLKAPLFATWATMI